MSNLITILITNYKSGGEAIFVGLLQGLVLWGAIAIFRGTKKAINGKKFEEVKEDFEKKSEKTEPK